MDRTEREKEHRSVDSGAVSGDSIKEGSNLPTTRAETLAAADGSGTQNRTLAAIGKTKSQRKKIAAIATIFSEDSKRIVVNLKVWQNLIIRKLCAVLVINDLDDKELNKPRTRAAFLYKLYDTVEEELGGEIARSLPDFIRSPALPRRTSYTNPNHRSSRNFS